ncbi:MAG TPA: aminotransferase class III-fold pyridoxal phosphate-dependent enzyme [Rhodospirillales bacterium]|nr:aminotransferase class III-fold pyridoxal phosphate-dependent enzyme [Rhodospirillales bacterium]HIL74559.1 aminotransferase class III-fold pyridoxal phosphate-dependent enzyme [Rhodospirillales bacterium]
MTRRSNSLAQRDIKNVLHPYTNIASHNDNGPTIITKGEGIYVYDEAGKKYMEGLSGLWCTSLGFNNKRLIEAANKAMRQLPFYHTFGSKSHPAAIALAEQLIEMAPVPMSKVFFANSGSEANDTAVKIIWYINNALGLEKKKKIIARKKSYHGVTLMTAGLTGLPNNHRDFDLPLSRVLHTDCPHFYRYGKTNESEEQFATRCADNLRKLILKEGPETIAAFFAEPVMGAGGVIPPPKTYFRKIQDILHEYQILFVADEVICGFGRTGRMFGTESYDLKPDMISLAKALSSGYQPISALMVSEDIFNLIAKESQKIGIFGHGYTYGGHPVPCAVALEAIKIYKQMDLIGHVGKIAPTLQNGLSKLNNHPLVGEARGVGLIGALELVKNKQTREAFNISDEVGALLATRIQANGLISRVMGDSLAFAPPLIIETSQIDEMLAIVEQSLDETLKILVDTGLK